MKKRLLFSAIIFLFSFQLFAQYNWQSLPNAPANWRLEDCYFLNPDTGWTISPNDTWVCQTPTQYGRIFRTTDAGQTWQLLKDSSLTFFRSVGFADALNGWIGNLADTSHYACGQITPDATPLYKTSDGGITLTAVNNIPNPKPAGICGISVVTDSIVYAYGRYFGPAVLIKTIDKGNNWLSTDMSPYATGLVDGYFFDKDTGFVSGNNGGHPLILSTYNGGLTWQTRYQSITINSGNLWKLSFPTRNVGYGSIEMNGLPYFVKTTDGGITWIEKPFLSTGYDEEGIGFINDSVGWIGGNTSQPNYKTVDGGNTWNPDLGFGTSIPPYFTWFDVNRFRRFGDTLMYASGNTMYKLNLNSSGVNELQNANGMNIFPNPNDGTFSVVVKNISPAMKIEIYNSLGEIVSTKNIVSENTSIDISNEATGIYFYKVISKDGMVSSGKFISE